MFGFLIPVRNDATYPLTDAAAALAFWQTLPRGDPIAAQEAMCKALAEPVPRGIRSDNRLQALLRLDQLARTLVHALLSSQDAASLPARSNATGSWQAAFELCRSFGRAYGQILRSIRENNEFEDRRDCQALALLRFFRQRQLELLLRPFTDDRAPGFSWKEMHDAYVLAQSRWLHREALPVRRDRSPGAVEARLEREYINVLVQDLMNGGQFPPYEASWVNRNLPRWCLALVLRRDEGPAGTSRFVVDPASDAGLVRSSSEPGEGFLCLDTTPLLKSLSAQIASLRDATQRSDGGATMRRGRRLKALQRVSALCSAGQPTAVRRGERRPTALTVEVVVGLPQILRRVRGGQGCDTGSPQCSQRDSENVTISGFGPSTEEASCANPDGGNTVTQSPPEGASHALLTMVDESDSGCRLHGPALAGNPTIPGALIAFRGYAGSPWRLAVVRNIKKRLAGRRIEVGVEYLGQDPRWVVVVAESGPESGKPAVREFPRFAGLYLLESVTQPRLPMKTLVLPACGLSVDARLSVRSRKSVHTVRLKEPLEEQADFIWSPFEILDSWVKSEVASSDAPAVSA